MDERAGHRAPDFAGRGQLGAFGVVAVEQRLRGVRGKDGGEVELVAAKAGAGRAQGSVRRQPGLTVSEMQLALREGAFEAEQPGHGVAGAAGVDQTLPEHHIASALAEHRFAGGGGAAQPLEKAGVSGQPSGMEFGIAAGEIHGVGGGGGRFAGQRRERQDFGARRPPRLQQPRVGEGESDVAGHRDPLPRRRRAGAMARRWAGQGERTGEGDQRRHVDFAGDDGGGAGEESLEVGMLGRLDQSEMAVGQGEFGVAAQGAEHRHSERGRRIPQHALVLVATDPVEDHPGQPQAGPEAVETMDGGRGRAGLSLDVHHQHHRPAGRLREIGGGATAARGAVEQAHHPLGDHEVGVFAGGPGQGRQGVRAHRPAVEIAAGTA